jgi:hypothetical protein
MDWNCFWPNERQFARLEPHLSTDTRGKPRANDRRVDIVHALASAGGEVADSTAADALLDQIPTAEIRHGDKGYDSGAVRRRIESNGAAPNIPPKANRRWRNCFSPYLYRNRNVSSACSSASRTYEE